MAKISQFYLVLFGSFFFKLFFLNVNEKLGTADVINDMDY